MRILLVVATLMLTISACDRSKGKGSDIEWQQRQEQLRQEEERRNDNTETQSIIYRDLEMQRRDLEPRD